MFAILNVNKGFILLRKIGFALIFALASIFISPLSAQAAVPSCGVSIVGAARIGQALTANVACSNSPTSYTYQWSMATSSSGPFTNISGANSQTYVAQPADVMKYLKVSATGSNADGTSAVTTNTTASGPLLFAAEDFVGSNVSATTDGTGTSASFTSIRGITSDAAGNLYVCDRGGKVIRKISPGGVVTTIAGSGTAAITDGIGLAASFNSPNAIAYSPTSNSLFIKDTSVIRELRLADMQVNTLNHTENVLTAARSGTTVTLTFAAHHFFYSQNVTVSGLGAPYDGTFAIGTPSVNSISYTVGSSATVAAFSPSGATVSATLGSTTANENAWWTVYESFRVGPDGNLYMIRGNAGESNTYGYLIRFVRVNGSTMQPTRLRSWTYGSADFDFGLTVNTIHIDTGVTSATYTTTDDWATSTVTSLSSTHYNRGILFDPAGYVYHNTVRHNLNTGATETVFATASVMASMWEQTANHIYLAADNGTKILRYQNAGSGQNWISLVNGTYNPNNTTVVFDANGGTGTMNAQSASSATNLTANAFTLSGSTFSGWNTAANGSGTSYADLASYSFAANLTLYAQWTAGQIQNNQVVQQPQVSNSLTAVTSWRVQSCETSPTSSFELTLQGRGLANATVTSMNSTAKVLTSSETDLTLKVSEISAAVNWLRVTGSDAVITIQDQFGCEKVIVPATATQVSVAFGANSAKVSLSEASRVKKLLSSFADPIEVSVLGYTSAAKATSADARLAAARAQATAKLIRAVYPKVAIKQDVSPAAGIGKSYRSALVTFSSTKR